MPDPVPELVSRNMVIPSLESSELGSTIKDAFVQLDLSSPQHADHLVLSMFGSTSKPCLEAKGFLLSCTLKYGKSNLK